MLCAVGLTLAMYFLRIPKIVWIGMAGGCLMGAIWYWWSNRYHQIHPADRMFEFVVLTVWCGISAGGAAFVAWAIRRRAH